MSQEKLEVVNILPDHQGLTTCRSPAPLGRGLVTPATLKQYQDIGSLAILVPKSLDNYCEEWGDLQSILGAMFSGRYCLHKRCEGSL